MTDKSKVAEKTKEIAVNLLRGAGEDLRLPARIDEMLCVFAHRRRLG